jgi:hypothetical protein
MVHFFLFSVGLFFGALASFFLSKELHSQNRHPLIVFPASAGGLKQQSDYPPSFSYDVDERGNIVKYSGKLASSNESESSSVCELAICNKIDSRKPFSEGEMAPLSPQLTSNLSFHAIRNVAYYNEDAPAPAPASAANHHHHAKKGDLEMTGHHRHSHPPPTDAGTNWSSRITQFNPFYSTDQYERVPEPAGV